MPLRRTVVMHILITGLLSLSVLSWSGCKEHPADANNAPVTYDYSYVNRYRSDFDPSRFTVFRENTYSRLHLVPGYLTESETTQLSAHIDTVINRICVYLNTNVEKEYHGFKGKVSYFVEPGIIPRCYGGSAIPIVSITKDNELLSMYAHETVHIFSMNTSSTWLIEGLAVHLADTLGIEELWPNYSEDLDRHAHRFVDNIFYKDGLALIGVNGFNGVDPTSLIGESYYTLSGSFIRYLMRHMGKTDFLKCYSSGDFKTSLLTTTQKNFDAWENEWLNYLRRLP